LGKEVLKETALFRKLGGVLVEPKSGDQSEHELHLVKGKGVKTFCEGKHKWGRHGKIFGAPSRRWNKKKEKGQDFLQRAARAS